MSAKNVTSWTLLALLLAAAVAPLASQVELDRIVSRVGNRIITTSDIRQARTLRLVDDTSSDLAVQRALEQRLLILHELERAAPLPPVEPDAIRARHSEWSTAVGGEAQVPDLLQAGGMSSADMEGWVRDDLRINAYLRRQFGMLDDTERTQAMDDWILRLRQRLDLPQ